MPKPVRWRFISPIILHCFLREVHCIIIFTTYFLTRHFLNCLNGIIPTRDAIFDLQAIGSTVQIVDMAKLKSCIVFNAVPARSSMIEQAKQAVEVYDVACSPCMLYQLLY